MALYYIKSGDLYLHFNQKEQYFFAQGQIGACLWKWEIANAFVQYNLSQFDITIEKAKINPNCKREILPTQLDVDNCIAQAKQELKK